MVNTKVYLQYPWKFPDSPYYKYLIDSPPKNVKYFNIANQKGVIINRKFFLTSNFMKKSIRNVFNFFRISLPNVHKTPKGDYDLIHCAHCLSKSKNKPWVADFESVWQMFIGERNKSSIKRVRKILNRKSCKAIIAWTEKCRKEIISIFPEISHKVKVVYPAIPLGKRNSKGDILNLIFIGRYFYKKGGHHSLEAIDILTKKYPSVKGIIISETPKELTKRFEENKKINFQKIIPQKEMFDKFLSKSDIFIYPGYSDSFGFSLIESMSFGVPIITVDGFARKEIVKNFKTGFVIKNKKNRKAMENKEIVSQIINKASQIIEDDSLRKSMSKNCINEIKNGNFSLNKRNSLLNEIYLSIKNE